MFIMLSITDDHFILFKISVIWVNEIGLELMLGYYVSIDSLDERNTSVGL